MDIDNKKPDCVVGISYINLGIVSCKQVVWGPSTMNVLVTPAVLISF